MMTASTTTASTTSTTTKVKHDKASERCRVDDDNEYDSTAVVNEKKHKDAVARDDD